MPRTVKQSRVPPGGCQWEQPEEFAIGNRMESIIACWCMIFCLALKDGETDGIGNAHRGLAEHGCRHVFRAESPDGCAEVRMPGAKWGSSPEKGDYTSASNGRGAFLNFRLIGSSTPSPFTGWGSGGQNGIQDDVGSKCERRRFRFSSGFRLVCCRSLSQIPLASGGSFDSSLRIQQTRRMLPRRVRLCLITVLLVTASLRTGFAARPESWVELRSPNFIVLSNTNEKQGRRVAYQFEMIRAVFREFFNIQSSAQDQPVIIIAAKSEDTLKALVPEYWAKKGSMHPAGIYLGGPEKNYVGLRLNVSMNQEACEPFEPVYHEYVHYLMRRMMSELPLWIVEGLAEFYGNTRLESKKVWVGAPSGSNIMVLRQNPPLPLDTLFRVNASSPYYHEDNKASIFYAESWVLTHYLITRDWREQTKRVNNFVALLGKHVAPEEAARRTIGDLGELQKALSEYIGHFSFTGSGL